MSCAPFVQTPVEVAKKMIQLASLGRGEMLFDLGAGDGRLVIMAAQETDASAVGVEIREDLAGTASEQLKKLYLGQKAQIIRGNLFDVDLSKADVVTLYLTSSANEKLRPKLGRELRPNSRVVSHDFSISGWKPSEVCEEPHGHTIYLYRIGSC